MVWVVASAVGIKRVVKVLSASKAAKILSLCQQSKVIMMVDYGINESLPLVISDVGSSYGHEH